MKVFDRGAELIGDERVKEIEEGLWFREMLTTEMVFGDEDGAVSDDEESEEVDWREVGNYWELNDGIGSVSKVTRSRHLKKVRFGWIEILPNGQQRDVQCGDGVWCEHGVCQCRMCELREYAMNQTYCKSQ